MVSLDLKAIRLLFSRHPRRENIKKETRKKIRGDFSAGSNLQKGNTIAILKGCNTLAGFAQLASKMVLPGRHDKNRSTRNTMVVFLLGSWRCCNLQSSSLSNFPVLLSCTPGTKESSLLLLVQHFEKGFTCFKVVCKSTRTICRDAILLALTTTCIGNGGQVVEDVLTSSLPTKLMRIFVYGV
ncbi:hypothetical protein LguiB_001667 [Lonicera macranthoides]